MGNSTRIRQILSEAKYGGTECPKTLSETKTCFKRCLKNGLEYSILKIYKFLSFKMIFFKEINEKIADCLVGPWSQWGECKMGKSCSDGYQERLRSIIRKNSNGGKECPVLKERRKCFLGMCESKKLN